MCFYVQEGKNSTSKVATKDIKCYKVFNRSECYGNQYGSYVRSYYQSFLYKVGVLYELDGYINPIKNFWDATIDVGLHSYSTLNKAKEQGWREYRVIYECIIPKGSTYYYNDRHCEYVSDQIIIVKRHV
jgi:hypothetical protein